MPFGLTNTSVIFYTLMNHIFHVFLDKFIVVYLNDILIYSRTMAEHLTHLRVVFNVFQAHQLYLNPTKCTFDLEEVGFLGHTMGHGWVKMDRSKVATIDQWPPPDSILELHSFLNLANYYKKFIHDFSQIPAPLTYLL